MDLVGRGAMTLRGLKNRRDLFGLHAPARLLVDLVPGSSIAVDAGAAQRLYAYWMAKRARRVHAFEPNPAMYRLLAAGAGRRVTPYNVALSDANGRAVLHVPASGRGEASLQRHGWAEETTVEVPTRTLDSYDLTDVGFLKVDVEGHEMSNLLFRRGRC